MAGLRKPLQGVGNIIRFNWHFYALFLVLVVCLLVLKGYLPGYLSVYIYSGIAVGTFLTLTSLVVSWYVYDYSNLYSLDWLDRINVNSTGNLLNINAGFDELSALLQVRYANASLTVLDFYDPLKHTEVSIKRARNAYPPYPGTIAISTNCIPLDDASIDTAFAILAAHEIRDDAERVVFFKQLNRALKQHGRVVVTEHLRDTPNFFAYNIGSFHFHSESTWLQTFTSSGFTVAEKHKITPFISTFLLRKHGTAS